MHLFFAAGPRSFDTLLARKDEVVPDDDLVQQTEVVEGPLRGFVEGVPNFGEDGVFGDLRAACAPADGGDLHYGPMCACGNARRFGNGVAFIIE